METLSTKSNVSPIGNSSEIWAARESGSAASSASAGVEKIGATARRCSSWRGASIEMKLVRSSAKSSAVAVSGGMNRVMPPCTDDEESRWLSLSQATMSAYLVIDQ